MLLLQLVTALLIFGSVRSMDPEGLNDGEKKEFDRCIQEEAKKGPDPEGSCRHHCYLKAINGIGTDGKIIVKNIYEKTWNRKTKDASDAVPQSNQKESKEFGDKFLKALEASCSSVKATGRCELGKKVPECVAKTFENLEKAA
nr:uncharacterized protein LOC108126238 [Drosophila bipectinata]